MILSPLSRQQNALRICRPLIHTQTQYLYNPKPQRRRKHNFPQLNHDEAFKKHGIPGMLSAEGYDMAWHQYHGHLVDHVNRLTADTKFTDVPMIDILIEHARNPDAASLFNHASMAWANHQFFTTLCPDPQNHPMSRHLAQAIGQSFSSVDSLRSTFIATANAMFGPGFVWLVRHRGRNDLLKGNELSILTTYIAGSPLPGAHYRRQEHDLNTAMKAGAFGSRSGNDDPIAYGGADLDILLGVNTWQHVWLRDWGVGGKKEFLEGWWNAIDWDVVEHNWRENRTKEKKTDLVDAMKANLPRFRRVEKSR